MLPAVESCLTQEEPTGQTGRPTQCGPRGIRFDFNHGARVQVLARAAGAWRVRLRDLDSGSVLLEDENQGALVTSSRRYYVRVGIEVWELDEAGNATEVLSHHYDASSKEVLIRLPVGTLGDTLGWFPYVARFAERHNARVTCAMSRPIIPLLQDAYPHIRFIPYDSQEEQQASRSAYATYSVALFFGDDATTHQPEDFRHVGLHRTAGHILGVGPQEEPPRLVLPDESRPIPEPYVCIAVQSSMQCKSWNNPHGWRDVIRFLKALGFRVVCIDQRPVHGSGLVWNHIPHGVDDQTGDRPLTERARWLRHAEFFVGLSSGLSWLAWAAGTAVVLISGFTNPSNEFATPYRVINQGVCNSCWNDSGLVFNGKDPLWCPRHAGTLRQFECTKRISSEQVIATIRRMPACEKRIAGLAITGSRASPSCW